LIGESRAEIVALSWLLRTNITQGLKKIIFLCLYTCIDYKYKNVVGCIQTENVKPNLIVP